MLETAIQENTAAIKELIKQLKDNAAPKETTKPKLAPVHAASEVIEPAKVAKAAPAKTAAAAPVVADDKNLPIVPEFVQKVQEPKASGISYDEIKKAVLQYSIANGRAGALKLLEQYGVANAQSLEESQYGAFLASCAAGPEDLDGDLA